MPSKRCSKHPEQVVGRHAAARVISETDVELTSANPEAPSSDLPLGLEILRLIQVTEDRFLEQQRHERRGFVIVHPEERAWVESYLRGPRS